MNTGSGIRLDRDGQPFNVIVIDVDEQRQMHIVRWLPDKHPEEGDGVFGYNDRLRLVTARHRVIPSRSSGHRVVRGKEYSQSDAPGETGRVEEAEAFLHQLHSRIQADTDHPVEVFQYPPLSTHLNVRADDVIWSRLITRIDRTHSPLMIDDVWMKRTMVTDLDDGDPIDIQIFRASQSGAGTPKAGRDNVKWEQMLRDHLEPALSALPFTRPVLKFRFRDSA